MHRGRTLWLHVPRSDVARVSELTLPPFERHRLAAADILRGYKVELVRTSDDQTDGAIDIERRGR